MSMKDIDINLINMVKQTLENKNREIEKLQEKIKEDKEIINQLIEEQTENENSIMQAAIDDLEDEIQILQSNIYDLEDENRRLNAELEFQRYRMLEIMSQLPGSNYEVKSLTKNNSDYTIIVHKGAETIDFTIAREYIEYVVDLIKSAYNKYKENK